MDKQEFLSFFEDKIRTKLIEFCAKINQSEADLYILMARKASCLITVLEEISLVSLNGKVISERLLDTHINWTGIKRIIIIDDVIISGTTLHRTIRKLKDININFDIKVIVIGIDSRWFNEELLQDKNGNSYIDYPIKVLDNSQCIRLSGDIVRMLSMFPMPYNIDFPIYQTIKLTQSDFRQFLNIPCWEVNDTSSLPQKSNNIFTFTFLPNEDHLELCGKLFNTPLIKESLIKVRVYGKKSEKKKEIYSLSLVPMAVLPPMREDQILQLFNFLTSDLNLLLSEKLSSITSKLRFIQFVIADKIAGLFISEIDRYTKKNVTLLRKSSSLRLLFPEELIGTILELTDNQLLDVDLSYNKLDIPLKKIKNNISLDNYININNALNKPFLDLYYDSEIPARKLAYKYGPEVFKKPEYKEYINRLNEGYSLLDLDNLLRNIGKETRMRIISVFLDKAVDCGIAVPITAIEGNIVYRAYRHGEDVQFGQREERLCFEMLNAFSDQVKKDNFQKLWVEKLFVFFIKIGENKFLEPIQTAINSYQHINGSDKNLAEVASVRYFLQGPVVVKSELKPDEMLDLNPCLDFGDKASWLSKYFVDQDTALKLPQKTGLYVFDKDLFKKQNHKTGHDREIVIDKELIKVPVEIGTIFGYLINNSIQLTKPSINSDELVVLSCCCEPKDIIGALAAEINIASIIWSDQKTSEENKKYNDLRDTLLKAFEKSESVNEALRAIHKGPLYRAINDGQRKFEWYLTKQSKVIIERISNDFSDVIYKGIWDSFWSPNIDWTDVSEKPKIIDLAKTEGIWLLCANLYLSMAELVLLTINKIDKDLLILEERIHEYYDRIRQYASHSKTREIIPFATKFITKLHETQYLKDTYPKIIERIDSLMFSAKIIKNDVEDFYSNYQDFPDIKFYTSAIYIETELIEALKLINNTFQSICYRITKTEEDNPATLKALPNFDNIIDGKNGKWYVGSGKGANFWLTQFATELINNLGIKYNAKYFLFPDIPNECSVKFIDDYKIRYNQFWLYITGFSEYISKTPFQNKILFTIRETKFRKSIIEEASKNQTFILQDQIEKSIRIPNLRSFTISRFINQSKSMIKKNANIGILTIVTEEHQAVLSEFRINLDQYNKIDNRFFYEQDYSINELVSKKIVVLQSSDQGNLSIINAYYTLIKNYDLDYIVLLGIAGSIQEKLKLCDVIIGTNVIYYEKKKELGHEVIQRRGEFFNNSFLLTQILNMFFTKYSEPAIFDSAIDSIYSTFSCVRGPIGSGETIVADPSSKTKEWLKTVSSKTGVVETESAGFSRAWFETNTIPDITVKDIIILRGISDHADYTKDDKWRLPASKNAAIVLKKLLEFLYR
jgi:nucleoside phosphorylase